MPQGKKKYEYMKTNPGLTSMPVDMGEWELVFVVFRPVAIIGSDELQYEENLYWRREL